MSEQRIINIADVPMKDVGNGAKFLARSGRVGPIIGSWALGCSVVVVPPGKSACPFHRHHIRDELFFVLEGEGVTRLDDQTLPIRAGDFIAAPAGKEAHQIINTGTGNLRYLALSAENPNDVIEYPDSGKIAVGAGFGRNRAGTVDRIGRLIQASYYDGEDV